MGCTWASSQGSDSVIRLTEHGPTSPSLREELSQGTTLAEVGFFVAVPAVLVLMYLQPEPAREGLVFQSARPTIITAFTAHYLHLTASHLVDNLVIYAGAVGLGYPLALLGGIRHRYLTLVVAVLLGFPFVLSTLHLVLIGTGGLVGFSGLALALVGLLPIALLAYLHDRIEGAVSINDAPALFFFGTAAIAARIGAPPEVIHPLIILSLGIAVLYLVPVALRLVRGGRSTESRPLRRGYVELPVAALILYFLFIAFGFPTGPSGSGEPTTNLVIHLLAYALGFLGGYLTERSLRALDTPGPPSPPPPST